MVDDKKGKELLDHPENFLHNDLIDKLKQSLTILFKLIVLDFNAFIKEKENSTFLDYKNFFKNKDFCTSLYTQIFTDHKKSIVRHPDDSFECIYNKE